MSASEGQVRQGHHGAYQIHYRMVLPVKYRKVMLDPEVSRIIEETSMEIQERNAIEFEALEMDGNHIHVLCAAHPKLSPGRIVQIFKSITARAIIRRRPQVKRRLWGGDFWSDGYYVATVGERGDWSAVERYVKRQGQPKEDLKQLRLS